MSIRAAHLVHLGDRFAVFDKPAGLSLATPRSAPAAAVERLVRALPAREREQVTGRELHLVHRLDEPTSGLVLVAFDADQHRELVAAFSERRVVKVYLALVWGRPRPPRGTYAQPLGPDRADRRRMKVDAAGRSAATDYRVLAVGDHVSLLALWPRTGRTHQLRVHLAAAGHPIVGDDLYGGPRHHGIRAEKLRQALDPGRALLHAWRLELPAPKRSRRDAGTLEPTRFEAPPPADFRSTLEASGITLADPGDLWQAPSPHPA